MSTPLPRTLHEQLEHLAEAVPRIRTLLGAPDEEQRGRGYFHTLREIAQQPLTWTTTARRMDAAVPAISELLDRSGVSARHASVLLTGSGSSLYAGASACHGLRSALGVPVFAVAGGDLLTDLDATLSPTDAVLVVSLARSGNSPESCGAIDLLLDRRPHNMHLVLTCCADGRLAMDYGNEPRVKTIVLDAATCDRSLVMTSSFTNLALGSRVLAFAKGVGSFDDLSSRLATIGQHILVHHGRHVSDLGGESFRSYVFLGSGGRFASARESALKMLEMTTGQVATLAESFLGLRHGPMSAVHDDSLFVCYLASDPLVRAYELDVIRELNTKGLKARKLIVGEAIPEASASQSDVLLECPGLTAVGDRHAPIVDALVGQLLAFFRCLSLGLKPDAPSPTGVITRVVQDFVIHRNPEP